MKKNVDWDEEEESDYEDTNASEEEESDAVKHIDSKTSKWTHYPPSEDEDD